MCNPRRLTRREMLGFVKWKRELEEEDVKELGVPLKRTPEHLHLLYTIYLNHNRP